MRLNEQIVLLNNIQDLRGRLHYEEQWIVDEMLLMTNKLLAYVADLENELAHTLVILNKQKEK